jgi:hypothetical protein
MGTVSKKIADEVIAGGYPEDEIVKIVKYQNSFDGSDSYGLIAEGMDLQTYRATEFVINPVTYWQKPGLPGADPRLKPLEDLTDDELLYLLQEQYQAE